MLRRLLNNNQALQPKDQYADAKIWPQSVSLQISRAIRQKTFPLEHKIRFRGKLISSFPGSISS
jgi:hypothetical protein